MDAADIEACLARIFKDDDDGASKNHAVPLQRPLSKTEEVVRVDRDWLSIRSGFRRATATESGIDRSLKDYKDGGTQMKVELVLKYSHYWPNLLVKAMRKLKAKADACASEKQKNERKRKIPSEQELKESRARMQRLRESRRRLAAQAPPQAAPEVPQDLGTTGTSAGEFSDSDDESGTPPTPGEELVQKILYLYTVNKITAEDCCTTMHLAQAAGIKEAAKYSLKPGQSSGDYARKLKDVLVGMGARGPAKWQLDLAVASVAAANAARSRGLQEQLPQVLQALLSGTDKDLFPGKKHVKKPGMDRRVKLTTSN